MEASKPGNAYDRQSDKAEVQKLARLVLEYCINSVKITGNGCSSGNEKGKKCIMKHCEVRYGRDSLEG